MLLALYPGAVSIGSGRYRSQDWRIRGLSAGHSLAIQRHRRKAGWHIESKVGMKVFPYMKNTCVSKERKKNQRKTS